VLWDAHIEQESVREAILSHDHWSSKYMPKGEALMIAFLIHERFHKSTSKELSRQMDRTGGTNVPQAMLQEHKSMGVDGGSGIPRRTSTTTASAAQHEHLSSMIKSIGQTLPEQLITGTILLNSHWNFI
jgi:hypothetical protein